MSPNKRFACRVSKSELAKLHACTGAMIPKQFTHTKKTPGSSSNGWKRNAYQKSRTFDAKKSSVATVSRRVPTRATARVYSGTKSVSAIGTAA